MRQSCLHTLNAGARQVRKPYSSLFTPRYDPSRISSLSLDLACFLPPIALHAPDEVPRSLFQLSVTQGVPSLNKSLNGSEKFHAISYRKILMPACKLHMSEVVNLWVDRRIGRHEFGESLSSNKPSQASRRFYRPTAYS
jgi:hypothetical protein